MLPRSKRYKTKGRKPTRSINLRNRAMQINAATPEVKIPRIISVHCTGNSLVARSKSFMKLAPAIAGIAIINEILDADSRLKPRKRAAVMVNPEREAPGISAKIWVAPIKIAEYKSNS